MGKQKYHRRTSKKGKPFYAGRGHSILETQKIHVRNMYGEKETIVRLRHYNKKYPLGFKVLSSKKVDGWV